MIIKHLDASTRPYAIALTIAEEQSLFVNSVDATLKHLKNTEQACVICLNSQPDSVVGFFLLDLDYASQHDFAEHHELGLRSLLIGHAFQGRGIGYQSMEDIRRFAQTHYRDYSHICLTVNEKNLAAYRCYQKAGYQDNGQRYTGGSAGPQHILRLALHKS